MPTRLPLAAPHRTAWRVPLVAACLTAAAAHAPVTGEHLHEALYIGVLFILLEIAAVVLAVVLLVAPSRAALLAVAGVGALAVLALVLSRTVGLPLIGDDIGNWAEPLAVVSLAAEAVMTVGGLAAALRRSEDSHRSLLVGAVTGVLLIAVGAAATGVATVAEDAPAAGTGGHSDMGGMRMG